MPAEAFVAARVEPRRVDSLSLVRFDANQYSVPTAFAHHPVTVVASVDDVRVVAGDRAAAVHRRCWGREQVTYDPVHYLAAARTQARGVGLRRPAGGLGVAGLLRGPAAAAGGRVRRGRGRGSTSRSCGCWSGPSPRELTRAVGRALELGVADADAVRLILEHRREQPVGLFSLDGRPHLRSVAVPPPDLSAYASLAAGVAS